MAENIEDDVVRDLKELIGLGIELSAAYAVADLLLSSSHARGLSFMASVRHADEGACLGLVAMTKCIREMTEPARPRRRRDTEEGLLRLDSQVERELYETTLGKPVVT